MTIHADHPFADPDPDPVRRLRGRLGGAVTLWTAGSGRDRAGLTVTSLMVAGGDPGRVLALLDPDADLTGALEATGRAVVQLLSWRHRQLAEAFAGTAPAPGGAFRTGDFADTEAGPRLVDADSWAAVLLEDARDVGWSRLVTCRLAEVAVGDDPEPLLHRRGRWVRAPAPGGH
ncbi:flavin reductase family protein [Nocardioides sp. GXQ0305]|uniref:flavin reductase family protein n=1 Tax=Nocardioides sp. GXQ0305 TaxID=3423912 RepID=UPI003D7F1742